MNFNMGFACAFADHWTCLAGENLSRTCRCNAELSNRVLPLQESMMFSFNLSVSVQHVAVIDASYLLHWCWHHSESCWLHWSIFFGNDSHMRLQSHSQWLQNIRHGPLWHQTSVRFRGGSFRRSLGSCSNTVGSVLIALGNFRFQICPCCFHFQWRNFASTTLSRKAPANNRR